MHGCVPFTSTINILHKLKQGMDMKSIPVLILLRDFSVHRCCVPVKYSVRVNHWYYCQVIISLPTNSQSCVSCWLEQQLLWARQLSVLNVLLIICPFFLKRRCLCAYYQDNLYRCKCRTPCLMFLSLVSKMCYLLGNVSCS